MRMRSPRLNLVDSERGPDALVTAGGKPRLFFDFGGYAPCSCRDVVCNLSVCDAAPKLDSLVLSRDSSKLALYVDR